MPITKAEWTERSLDPDRSPTEPNPVPLDTDPAEEIRQFLETNAELAFTRAEIIRGVHASEQIQPDRLGEILAALPNQFADLTADFESSGIDVSAYGDAITELDSDGPIACAHVERMDGEPAVYRRNRPSASGSSGNRRFP